MNTTYKYFTFLSVLFVTVLLISNIVSTKITDLGWFVFDAGKITTVFIIKVVNSFLEFFDFG
jgi:hypothetical protein